MLQFLLLRKFKRKKQAIRELENRICEMDMTIYEMNSELCTIYSAWKYDEEKNERLINIVKKLRARCTKHRMKNRELEGRINISIDLRKFRSLQNVKKRWLKIWIDKLPETGGGSGGVYELYQERIQTAIDTFLAENHHLLTDEEIKQLKQHPDYCEDYEPYCEYDEEEGRCLNAKELAEKIVYG